MFDFDQLWNFSCDCQASSGAEASGDNFERGWLRVERCGFENFEERRRVSFEQEF